MPSARSAATSGSTVVRSSRSRRNSARDSSFPRTAPSVLSNRRVLPSREQFGSYVHETPTPEGAPQPHAKRQQKSERASWMDPLEADGRTALRLAQHNQVF